MQGSGIKSTGAMVMDLTDKEPFRSAMSQIFRTDPGLQTLWALDDYMDQYGGCLIGQVNFDECHSVIAYDYTEAAIVNRKPPVMNAPENIISGDELYYGNYDCHESDRYAIFMSSAKMLEKPIPFKGSQGFFFYNSLEHLKLKK